MCSINMLLSKYALNNINMSTTNLKDGTADVEAFWLLYWK